MIEKTAENALQIQPRTNTLHANQTRTGRLGVSLIVVVASSLLTPQDVISTELTTRAPSLKAEGLDSVRSSTFTDANWISMGGIPGANGEVRAAASDSSGNLYIGGLFTIVGETFATNV